MSIGSTAGASCYATQAEAAAAWCAGVSGVTSAGVLSCSGVSGVGDAVGAGSFSWTHRLVDSSGQVHTSTVAGQQLQSCERYDLAYWEPMVSAFVSASILIVAGRLVYRVFNRDGDA